jgi:predicted RNA binding protein YcfA (HicA-like mRNA interferase family)
VGRMASIVAFRMIKALVRLGWSVDRASGTSHHVLTKPGHMHNPWPASQSAFMRSGAWRT